jgi:hypothetical protein
VQRYASEPDKKKRRRATYSVCANNTKEGPSYTPCASGDVMRDGERGGGVIYKRTSINLGALGFLGRAWRHLPCSACRSRFRAPPPSSAIHPPSFSPSFSYLLHPHFLLRHTQTERRQHKRHTRQSTTVTTPAMSTPTPSNTFSAPPLQTTPTDSGSGSGGSGGGGGGGSGLGGPSSSLYRAHRSPSLDSMLTIARSLYLPR